MMDDFVVGEVLDDLTAVTSGEGIRAFAEKVVTLKKKDATEVIETLGLLLVAKMAVEVEKLEQLEDDNSRIYI
jgi:hypothetical protein